MLRTTIDVNGWVIGIALARNTGVVEDGQTIYRAAYVDLDNNQAYTAQVKHDYLDGAPALVSVCMSLVYFVESKPYFEKGVLAWVNADYNSQESVY